MFKKWAPAAFVLSFAILFLVLNRHAYRGYFQDDEFDTISWTPYVPVAHYVEGLVTPKFSVENFRPVGHAFIYLASKLFRLKFGNWVDAIELIHVLNVWLLWMLARRLGARPLATGAACLFFGLHAALFDVVWKPMYVFDLLCATGCLAAMLAYVHGKWVLAFVAFWLAYKSKEVAVMLPAVLLAMEVLFWKESWRRRVPRLAPFFLVSLSFGVQAMLLSPHRQDAYTFRF